MTVRAIVAEDEGVLRAHMREMLAQVWPELDVVALVEDGVKAAQAIEKHMPDVLFLDIQMPGMSGLDVARLASGRCHVVFVTAFDQHAVAAFEHGAADYVMKPVSAARLFTACERVRQRLSLKPVNLDRLLIALAEGRAGAKPYLRWINASTGESQCPGRRRPERERARVAQVEGAQGNIGRQRRLRTPLPADVAKIATLGMNPALSCTSKIRARMFWGKVSPSARY